VKTILIGLYGGGAVKVRDGRIDCSAVTPAPIAHGLAQVNRFGGQTRWPYAVGEHSVRLARWAHRNGESRFVCLALLIHDAPECLGVGDVQKFIKRAYAKRLRSFDRALTVSLWRHMVPGAPPWRDVEDKVHAYDGAIGAYEAKFFDFAHDASEFDVAPPGLEDDRNLPAHWSPRYARHQWLNEWEALQ
jgi:hypothetical protein